METGHAKTVANFETVVIILANLGTAYNPSQALIMLPALQHKLTEAKAILNAVDAAEAARSIAIDERQDEYEELDKYVVNIKRAAEVEVNDPAFTNDLATIVRRFQPKDKPAAPPAGVSAEAGIPPPRTRSTSQRSYDSQIAHLADMIALLRTKSSYKPNDEEVKIASIETKLAALETKNNAAKTAVAACGTTKDARDAVLYDDDTGLIKLVKLVKTHLARKPGRESPAYQQVNALEFRKS
jgi:hypothetical protein